MGPMKAKRKPKPSRITTSKSSAETEKWQRKVQIFLEGHKNLAHRPLILSLTPPSNAEKSGRWAEFLWPRQNM